MGIKNFHVANANKQYIVKNVSEKLLNELKKNLNSFKLDNTIESVESLPAYPTKSIGFYYKNIETMGLDVDVRLNIFVRKGFFSNNVLDYELSISTMNSSFSSVVEFIKDIGNNYEYYLIADDEVRAARKTINKVISKTIEIMENNINIIFNKNKQVSE